jgi:hypothetical protein
MTCPTRNIDRGQHAELARAEHTIRIPIKYRVVCGFNPTNGSRKKYAFREMDVRTVGFRLYGNWTEHVLLLSK